MYKTRRPRQWKPHWLREQTTNALPDQVNDDGR